MPPDGAYDAQYCAFSVATPAHPAGVNIGWLSAVVQVGSVDAPWIWFCESPRIPDSLWLCHGDKAVEVFHVTAYESLARLVAWRRWGPHEDSYMTDIQGYVQRATGRTTTTFWGERSATPGPT
jgi:hypothetical protein